MTRKDSNMVSDRSVTKLVFEGRIGSPMHTGDGTSISGVRQVFEKSKSKTNMIKIQENLRKRLRNRLKKQK